MSSLQPQKASTNKKEYECLHCPFKSRCQRIFDKHDACHNRNPAAKYSCSFCSYSSHNPGRLHSHVSNLHSQEILEGMNNSDDHHENVDPTNPAHDESRTRKDEQGTTALFMNKNTANNSSIKQSIAAPPKRKEEQWHILPDGKRKRYKLCEDCPYKTLKSKSLDGHMKLWHPFAATTAMQPKRKDEQWHVYPDGTRKRYKLCEDCNYKTLKNKSLDGHIKLWHPIAATTPMQRGATTNEEQFNNIDEHQNTEKVDGLSLNDESTGSQARKQFDVEECRVSLRGIHSSPARANPENVEQIPFEEPDKTADVDEPEDGNILSLRSRLVFMKEKARSAEEEMDAIFSKKVEIRNKINKMNGTRVYEELNLRFQQRTLLEICISAHDAGEDHRTFTQSMVEQVRMLENDMDELDRQLDALNEEEKSLAEELEFAQGSHLGVVEVIDALYSELNGRYC